MGQCHGSGRLSQGADLVDLHKDAVGNALGNATAKPLGIGDEKVVANELNLFTDLFTDQLPALPVILRAAIFDRHDRVLSRQICQKVNHASRVEGLALDRICARLGVVEFSRGHIERDRNLLAGLVAGIADRGEDHLECLAARADLWGEATLVTNGRDQPFVLEHLLKGMEGLDTCPQSRVKRIEAQRHHHELLHVKRVVGVGATINDVHHRGGQQPGGRTAEIAVQRHAAVLSRRVGSRQRNAQDRIRAKGFLV